MLRDAFQIIVIFCVVVFLLSCAHFSTEQRTLIFKDDKTEKRVEYLQDKLRTNPDDVESNMELGKIFLKEDFNEEAINKFERVLSIDSNNIQAYLLLSLALQRRPKPDLLKAAENLEKAAQIAQDNAEVHLNLAQIYVQLKKEENAITEFNRVVELSDNPLYLVSAHLGLMAIYTRQGESAKTDNEYEKARQIYLDVDEIIKQAEIDRITPHPQCPGSACGEGEGHPMYDERIKQLQKVIKEYE